DLLGGDCAGIVSAIAPSVTIYQIGDKVMGFAEGSFATQAVSRVEWLVKKPTTWSFIQAATVPTVFLTVYYSLIELAQIKSGDKVLIHAAAGGVGLAAIQMAKFRAADILTTVGSVAKRRYLNSLGIKHVSDSRSSSFDSAILASTRGQGVNVVLNSLTGE